MTILVFHNTSPDIHLDLNNYHSDRLRIILKNIKLSGYDFVSIDSILNHNSDSKKIAVTFDDGLESIYNYACPILTELEIPAIVFLPSGFIGKMASWDYSSIFRKSKHLTQSQIAELLKNNITIGSHGVTHTSLAGLSERLLKLELQESKKKLEDLFGAEVNYISYPFGRFNNKVEDAALEAGYIKGFSMGAKAKRNRGFTLRRHAVYSFDTGYSIMAKIEGGLKGSFEQFKESTINSYSYGTILLNQIRYSDLTRQHS